MSTTTKITIHSETTVGDLMRELGKLDPRHEFLVQAILPDGTAWNSTAEIFFIPNSNCGEGLSYLGLQIRCDGSIGGDV